MFNFMIKPTSNKLSLTSSNMKTGKEIDKISINIFSYVSNIFSIISLHIFLSLFVCV